MGKYGYICCRLIAIYARLFLIWRHMGVEASKHAGTYNYSLLKKNNENLAPRPTTASSVKYICSD